MPVFHVVIFTKTFTILIMNRFTKADFKKRIFSSFSISVFTFVLVIGLFIYGISAISGSSVVNDREILTDAINRDIIHCYCVEGMYPPSVNYMKEHYGLTYDESKYIIDYEYIGANILPSVMIIPKNAAVN